MASLLLKLLASWTKNWVTRKYHISWSCQYYRLPTYQQHYGFREHYWEITSDKSLCAAAQLKAVAVHLQITSLMIVHRTVSTPVQFNKSMVDRIVRRRDNKSTFQKRGISLPSWNLCLMTHISKLLIINNVMHIIGIDHVIELYSL